PQAQPPYHALLALPAWPVLAGWARTTLHLGHDDGCELPLPTPGGGSHQVLLRARLTRPNPQGAAACVIFLEDLRDVETRVRNEKLAAMGRVSAAVAHEIRNPLAAIAHANALLGEESLTPIQQRLAAMIGQNAKRLGRTVDDILDAAQLPARPTTPPQHTPLDACVATTVAEWHAQQAGQPAPQWQPGAPGLQVRFDPEHLRRVLVNLLDNARKYGSGGTGAIHIATHPNGRLRVWNPGPPLPEDVAQHLFEPFASSHSRSSGLGLYLSRELCQHHGAQLHHRPSAREGVPGHGFVVTLQSL
ncbi:sensor histidine kinase KdpD, partial [Aquabacterium sp. A08]|uniref:sensor histidine kinase n=1 Tax=Aquabacterium sp. A08 TaxID=2718532 RepID=UPI001422D3EC